MPVVQPDSRNSNSKSYTAFELVLVQDHDQAFTDMAGAFHADCSEMWQFRKAALTEELILLLTECASMTYVPADATWVRMFLDLDDDYHNLFRSAPG